jgi:hypothetical protein
MVQHKKWILGFGLSAAVFFIAALLIAGAAMGGDSGFADDRIADLSVIEGGSGGAYAASSVTSSIHYQGKLTDIAGNPLNGTYTMTFKLYETFTGGTALDADTHSLIVNNGLLSTTITFDPSYFDGRALWLGIQVESDPEMTPRQALQPVPYALSLRPGAIIAGYGEALKLYTLGPSNTGLVVSANGTDSVGMHAITTGAESEGVIAETHGADSVGVGIVTYGDGSEGIYAYTTGHESDGVYAVTTGDDSPAVYGWSEKDVGVCGTGPTGVEGFSQSGRGVFGESDLGDGVQGYGGVNGVYGETSSYGGQGVFGVGKGDNAEGVMGSAEGSAGIGVYGMAAGSGDGVRGLNKATGDGVHGIAGASDKSGVYGFNTGAGYGVAGRSVDGWGVEADGNDASNSDRVGDLVLGGNIGEIFSFGHLGIYADHDAYIDLDDDNNDANAKFVIFDGTDTFRLTIDENGNLSASGTKSATVQTDNYGQRLLYAVESPGVWFEDFGKTSLVNGEATVAFEPIFAETVNLEADYHVFLTPLCQEPVLLFVTAKSAKGFTVRGVTLNGQPTGCAFDYRVVAKRLGYEQVRLEEAIWPEESTER